MKIKIFKEQEYKQRMDGEVATWKAAHVKQGMFRSFDGTKIHYLRAVHEAPRASIVLVHGFTEYAERYLEMLYYFYQEGYSVFMTDNRGHGRSGRKIPQIDRVFVRSFDEYTGDLKYFCEHIVIPSDPGRDLLLFAHSMGGAIAALFLEQYPEFFKAAILSSPMLKMKLGNVPSAVIDALAGFSRIMGWQVQLAPGQKGFSPEIDYGMNCGTSLARFEYEYQQKIDRKAYRTTAATYAWSRAAVAATKLLQKEAGKVKIPLLILQAGNDDLVDNAGEDRFAEAVEQGQLIRFPTARHEIWNSTEDVLEPYYESIFRFFGSVL